MNLRWVRFALVLCGAIGAVGADLSRAQQRPTQAPSFVNFLLRGDGASGSVTVSPTLTGTGGTPFVCTLVQGVAQPGCSGTFDPGGGTVTLTAIPAPGSRFAGWDVTLSDDYGVPPTPRCADPLSTTCVLTFVHGNGLIDGYVNFAPQ